MPMPSACRCRSLPRLPGRGHQSGEYPAHAVLDLARDPGVLRGDAGRRAAFAQVSGLIQRQARTQDVTRRVRQHGRRQGRERGPQFRPVPLHAAQEPLKPERALVTCGLGKGPAVRPGIPAQRQDVGQRRRHAARLPHHPGQCAPDQRVRPRPALRDIFYAGYRGRGIFFCFPRKLQTSHGRPAFRPGREPPR